MLFAILSFSCNEEVTYNGNHNTVVVNETDKIKKHKIKFNTQHLSPLFLIEMRCTNPKNFNKDSIEFISYQKIEISDYDKLSIIEEKNKLKFLGFTLEENKKLVSRIFYPTNAVSRYASILKNIKRKKKCISEFNSLMRIEYNLDQEEGIKYRYAKVLGYSNSSSTNVGNFDWNYFFTNPDNLYNIYSGDRNCNKKWKFNVKQ